MPCGRSVEEDRDGALLPGPEALHDGPPPRRQRGCVGPVVAFRGFAALVDGYRRIACAVQVVPQTFQDVDLRVEGSVDIGSEDQDRPCLIQVTARRDEMEGV